LLRTLLRFSFATCPGPAGKLIALIPLAWDITERKQGQAAQAARTSEQQYRLLFAANPNPMWVFDEETLQFLAVNDCNQKQGKSV
jgi:hypothetical protein